jgi:hypothetical protein
MIFKPTSLQGLSSFQRVEPYITALSIPIARFIIDGSPDIYTPLSFPVRLFLPDF